MNKLNGEAVEKEVAASVRTMHKTGKAFAQRGMQTYAFNCDVIKVEIEDFQKLVPLLVVGSPPFKARSHPGTVVSKAKLSLLACSSYLFQRCLGLAECGDIV